MNWSKWIRQFHRWMSIAFTLGFIINVVALSAGGEPPFWIYLTALIPLFLLYYLLADRIHQQTAYSM